MRSDSDDSTAKDDATEDNTVEDYLPLLALRDVVVYPHMQIALFVGRAPSVKAVELAQAEYGNKVLVVAQKDSLTEDIDQDNLYQYGTVCRIVSTMPHDSDENCIKVLIEGQYRARVDAIEDHDELLMANFERADLDVSMDESQQKNTIQALTTYLKAMRMRVCVMRVSSLAWQNVLMICLSWSTSSQRVCRWILI